MSGDKNELVECDSLASFSSDSRRLFVRHQYRGLVTFDVAADTVRDSSTFADGFDDVRAVVPLADRRVLTLHKRSAHQLVMIEWDLADRSVPRRIAEVSAECDHCLVTPDGKLVLTAQERPATRVAVWEVDTGRLLGDLEPPNARIDTLVATPAGDLVAGACIDGNIYVWELRTRKLVRTLRGHDSGVRNLDLASDGRTLASASADQHVRLWDVRTGASLPIKLIHPVPVWSVAFCPDEPLVATGDASGKVRIWSLSTGEELLTLAQLDGTVTGIRFSPDGRWLAAESNAKSERIHLWQAPN